MGKKPAPRKPPQEASQGAHVFTALICAGLVGWALYSGISSPSNGQTVSVDSGREEREETRVIECWAAIRAQAAIPDDVDLDDWKYVDDGGAGESAVMGHAEFRNAFGTMMPQKYGCKFHDGILVQASIFSGRWW